MPMGPAEAGRSRPPLDDRTTLKLDPEHDPDLEPATTCPSGRDRDLRQTLALHQDLGEDELLELFCNDQVDRWCEGVRIPAEAYLALHPALDDRSEGAFDLIYGEFVLRESLGDGPRPEEFFWRFPRFADRFRRQLDLHQALRSEDLACRPDRDEHRAGDDPEGETLVSGPEVSGYRILRVLGHGGMGVVYLARHLSLNRLVALKVIHAGDPEAMARFRAEAEAVARFHHPNLIQVYEVGEHADLGYLALEYAAGGSLQQKLAGTPQDPRAAALLLEDLALAVDYAHRQGIVHRDLKPANVVLTEEGVPKITDFGLAKLLEHGESLTHTGAILGTPSYMAPEQARGHSREITPATDVYALGAILYEMLTGHPPFKGSSPISTLEQVATQEPIPPGRLQRHAPRDLETISLKCLEKEPKQRYPGGRELADDLRRFLDGRPILARPTPTWTKAWKWARRKPSTAMALACVVLAVVVLLLGSTYYNARLRVAVRNARTAERASEASARAALEQRNLALKALDQLVYGVQEKLGAMPATRPLRRGLLDTALTGLDEIARSAEATTPDLSRAVAHQKLGEIFRQVGRAVEARRQLDQSIGLAERLAAASPRDVAVADCLYAAYYSLGELDLMSGRLDESKSSFRRVVTLAESIARTDPGHVGARRGLIEAYFELGRAHSFGRELASADVWFQKMHDLAERWVAEEPDNVGAKDLLASSYRKLADQRKLTRDLDAARTGYLKAIALGHETLLADPQNLDYKTHLAIALEDLAGVEARRLSPEEARRLYDESQRLFEELVAADPENLQNRMRLVQTLCNEASLVREQSQFAEAACLFRRAREHLANLRREGRLEGRPPVQIRRHEAIEREIAFCEAAPGLLDDLDAIRSRPSADACRLLVFRARATTAQGRRPDLVAAANALCELDAETTDDLWALARSLAECIAPLEDPRWDNPPEPDLRPLRDRCADRAVSVLARAADRDSGGWQAIEGDSSLASLRHHPAYGALVDRLKRARTLPGR